MTAPLALDVRGLTTSFHTDDGTVYAVNGISYSLRPGESLAIVGESGSGKTVAALSVMDLVPRTAAVRADGISLAGRDLRGLTRREWTRVRGREIAMVFQDPMTSLNPVLSVGAQVMEVLRRHMGSTRSEARDRAAELLEMVGIPNGRGRLRDFPHEFSGGQRQRIMIAMALACEPAVLIADEPTTALDVTIQAQIVELVKDLQARLGMAIVWITHDLALVAGLVDRILVMYAGRVVEEAVTDRLFATPAHPYTLGLLRSMPRVDGAGPSRLHPIDGAPPDLSVRATGCPFAPRCPFVVDDCRKAVPALRTVGPEHTAACIRTEQVAEVGR